MMADALLVDRAGAVVHVRLNRPPHNFFDVALVGGIADAVEAADADPAARAVLLSAEGRNFCAGLDFRHDDLGSAEALYANAARLHARRKPMIAAVQGAAVGGGLGLALAADFRVGGAAARFQANFVALGLYPGFAISAALPALVGAQKARDMLLTGRSVAAEEALAIGLIDRLAPAEAPVEAALAFASAIAAHPPLAVQALCDGFRTLDGESAARAMAGEIVIQHRLAATEDFAESRAARAQKRPPLFEGR